jgi:hypothetical protein
LRFLFCIGMLGLLRALLLLVERLRASNRTKRDGT